MKIIGHRGAKGLAPENTIAGFKKAIELGVDMIEFDVRVTKDHVPVIHHDKSLHQVANIKQSSYTELKKHEKSLVTLEETLKFIDGRVALYIEVKMKVDVGPVILELNKYHHEFYLGSKSQKTLVKLHRAFPDVPKIVIEPVSAIRAVWRAAQVRTTILAMNHHFMWSGVIRKLSKRGYKVLAYPLNDPVKAKRWEECGLDGVVTDYPDRFLK